MAGDATVSASSSMPACASSSQLTFGGELLDLDAHVQRAWDFFRSIGSPALHVAPMVDQSELPFRMLCRAHGAQAAYTPMMGARLFVQSPQYRDEHFTTCEGDRPLFVQFCAHDPQLLLAAGQLVQGSCDYVDLNLGCPQRIAKKGYYGAFLMDDLPLVEALVSTAAKGLRVPVSCKIRIFPEVQRTVAYAQMLQAAGCSLLAVHGRTRDMKDLSKHRADWAHIAAVRAAVRVPVLANGNVRTLAEARALMATTGADGVMSAEPLLVDPALFAARRLQQPHSDLDGLELCRQYVLLTQCHPVIPRMVRGHVHKLLANWLAEFQDLREELSVGGFEWTAEALLSLLNELDKRVAATGRDYAVPKISARKLALMQQEAAVAAAIAEQEREAQALAQLDAAAAACDPAALAVAEAAVEAGAAAAEAMDLEACAAAAVAEVDGHGMASAGACDGLSSSDAAARQHEHRVGAGCCSPEQPPQQQAVAVEEQQHLRQQWRHKQQQPQQIYSSASQAREFEPAAKRQNQAVF